MSNSTENPSTKKKEILLGKGYLSEVTCYMDSENVLHETLQEANKAQVEINLNKFFNHYGVFRGGEWSQEMVMQVIMGNYGVFQDAINTEVD